MPDQVLTIVFRGLVVFSILGPEESAFGEVGILYTAPGHFLRVNTVKNCVLETVGAIKRQDIQNLPRNWQIVIENPVENMVTAYKPGEFDRKSPDFTRDFRWIIDLEGEEFYKVDLTEQLDTSILRPIIRIPTGQLYTRLKSRALDRIKGNDPPENFGFISAAIGCDIRIKADTRVTLNAGERELFEFEFNEKDPHTIYEIVNTPPDVQGHERTPQDHDRQPPKPGINDRFKHYHLMLNDESVTKLRFEVEREANLSGKLSAELPRATGTNMPPEQCGMEMSTSKESKTFDHFIHYYSLFKDPNVVKFRFEERRPDPGPRPALCGIVMLGKRKGAL